MSQELGYVDSNVFIYPIMYDETKVGSARIVLEVFDIFDISSVFLL